MPDHRRGPDRRRAPRGGRRRGDQNGFTPLLFVIDENAARREACSLLLLHHRFAVAKFESAERAAAVLESLKPETIIASPNEIDRVRTHVSLRLGAIPVIPLNADNEALIRALRLAIRSTLAT